jgi:hypothetical protein
MITHCTILMIIFQIAMKKGRDTLDTHLNKEGLYMTIYSAGVEEYGKILLPSLMI